MNGGADIARMYGAPSPRWHLSCTLRSFIVINNFHVRRVPILFPREKTPPTVC